MCVRGACVLSTACACLSACAWFLCVRMCGFGYALTRSVRYQCLDHEQTCTCCSHEVPQGYGDLRCCAKITRKFSSKNFGTALIFLHLLFLCLTLLPLTHPTKDSRKQQKVDRIIIDLFFFLFCEGQGIFSCRGLSHTPATLFTPYTHDAKS